MMTLRTIALSLVLAAGATACADDDDKPTDTRDTTEVSDGETTPDGTVPDATEPDGTLPDGTDATDATETTPDVTETSDGEIIEPPPNFATFVIDLVQSQSNTTEPVPFADFSTLDEDNSEDAFSTVTFP